MPASGKRLPVGERRVLDQFDQDAHCPPRVEERDATAAGARSWMVIDELDTESVEVPESCGEVSDAVADVMYPRTATLEESGYR